MGALAGAADLLFGPSHVESVRVTTVNNARTNANLNPRLSGCCAMFPLVAPTGLWETKQQKCMNYFTLGPGRNDRTKKLGLGAI